MPKDRPQLAKLRREIDQIDQGLHALLVKRAGVVHKVRAQKDKKAVHLRPAREITMLAALLKKPRGHLPSALIVRLWREMISAFTLDEQMFTVAVTCDTWALARDHFGGCVPLVCVADDKAVTQAVLKGKVTLGVLGWSSAVHWSATLAQQNKQRVFMQIPHVVGKAGATNAEEKNTALVIGNMPPERTGRDRTLVVVNGGGKIGKTAGKVVAKGKDAVVLELAGWLDMTPTQRQKLAAKLGVKRHNLHMIGGYALPVQS